MGACLTCSGDKVVRGRGCPGFKLVEFPCFDCKGAGVLDDVRLAWIAEGVRLREYRKGRDLSAREAAQWCGVQLSVWNEAEYGRIDPAAVWNIVQRKAMDTAMAPLREEARDDD